MAEASGLADPALQSATGQLVSSGGNNQVILAPDPSRILVALAAGTLGQPVIVAIGGPGALPYLVTLASGGQLVFEWSKWGPLVGMSFSTSSAGVGDVVSWATVTLRR